MEQIVRKAKLTYSIAEAAQVLGVSETHMRTYARMEGFPVFTIGHRLLVSVKGLEKWVEEQAQKGLYG